jgi:hypothetical protein
LLSCQIVDATSKQERALHEFVAPRTTVVVSSRLAAAVPLRRGSV